VLRQRVVGVSDQIVGIDNARRLFDAARHPKSFVSLDRADHLLTDPGDAELAGAFIASWARRYVARAREVHWKRDPADNRVMARTGAGLRTEILADGLRDGKLDRFERELELSGPLYRQQGARLLEIANRCPVHHTLEEGPIEITTGLVEADSPASVQS
jgi:hypothetical protein